MLLDVRRKSDWVHVQIDTYLDPLWDCTHVWLSNQPLGRFHGQTKEEFMVDSERVLQETLNPVKAKVVELVAPDVLAEDVSTEEGVEPNSLEYRQEQYVAKFNKPLAPAYKNNLERIKSKLEETAE